MGYDATITRLPISARFDIQGAETAVADWCGDRLPPFPTAPNSLTTSNGRDLMWIGRDRWQLRADIAEEARLVTALRPDAAPEGISIIVISDALTAFAIDGPDMHEVMSVATPLDIHPDAFPEDGASWTEAFGTRALIRRSGGGFELAVDRSYGDWFEACLRSTVA